MWSSSAIGWFSTFSCSLSSCNKAAAKPTTFSKWLMSMRMKACGCWCILCVLLYLVTRWLWNTAEAWTAHVSQWGPIAQCLIHGVNKHIICLWTQWRWNKAAHLQVYSWHTHGGLSWILDWRPRTGWLFMWRLQLFAATTGQVAILSLTLSRRGFLDHTQSIGG